MATGPGYLPWEPARGGPPHVSLGTLLPPPQKRLVIVKFEGCIADVKQWTSSNFLKLNDYKTEILLLSKRDIKQLPHSDTGINISQKN